MRNAAFIFPGQGSQYIGMGKDFYDEFKESRYVLEEASDALSMDLRKLCFDGSEEELRKTENTQPAILATSIAMLRVVEKEGIDCEYTAGLSLGEYTSIVLSGELNGLKSASKKALELGAKKVVELPLSAPFHSSLLFKALNISDLESFDRTMKILQGGV